MHTHMNMLPSFGQPYTFCIGLKNKRSESIDDSAGEGGGGGGAGDGGGGGRTSNTNSSSAALSSSSTMMNGSTEIMNGNIDPAAIRSATTTITTTTTTTITTTTKEQHKLTNGVTEDAFEPNHNSEKTDLLQVELRNNTIEAISEESTSLGTCSILASTISTK